jgi:hypothetical protein
MTQTFFNTYTALFQHCGTLLNISSKLIHSSLDPALIASLLFIHTLFGCESVIQPRSYRIEKVSAMAKYKDLREPASVFITTETSQKAVEAAVN